MWEYSHDGKQLENKWVFRRLQKTGKVCADVMKVVSESHGTWATSVPILVIPRPICSRLRPDIHNRHVRRCQMSDAHHRLMPLPYRGGAEA